MTQTPSTPGRPAASVAEAAQDRAGSAPRVFDTLVIHCSATHSGRPLGNGRFGSAAAVIDRWHAARGFARQPWAVQRYNPGLRAIGYHFVIDTDGRCDLGRALNEVGAHAAGYNSASVGICMVGGLEPVGRYTPEQWASLADLVVALKRPTVTRIVGHRDLSPDANRDGKVDARDWLKTCPGFDVAGWLAADMTPAPAHVFAGGDHV